MEYVKKKKKKSKRENYENINIIKLSFTAFYSRPQQHRFQHAAMFPKAPSH